MHYLLAAELYGFVSPGHAVRLADQGLKHLTPLGFRRDITALLHEKGMLAPFVEPLMALEESDIRDLADLMTLSPEDRVTLMAASKELARRRNEPPRQVLADVAVSLWPVIAPRVTSQLQRLANPPIAAKHPTMAVRNE